MAHKKIVLKPCSPGFEPLEGEIKKAIGARPDEPVPPSLQARFLGLLSIAQRARGAPQEIDKELDELQDEAATVLLRQDRQNKTAREEAPLLAARVAALNEDATEEELEAARVVREVLYLRAELNQAHPNYLQIALRLSHLRELMSPDVQRGKGTLRNASKGGEERARGYKSKHPNWQSQADELWKINPRLSKLEVARRIAKNTNAAQSTIRNIIKKK